jgi:hypothetical protein
LRCKVPAGTQWLEVSMTTPDSESAVHAAPTHSSPSSSSGAVHLRRTRIVLLRSFYGLVSLSVLLMANGALSVVVGHVPAGMSPFAGWVTTAWKLLSLGGALIVCATAGRSIIAIQWFAVGEGCWLLAGVLAPQDGEPRGLAAVAKAALNLTIWLGPWLLLASHRRDILRLRLHPDRMLVLTWCAAAVPLLLWANALRHAPLEGTDHYAGAELRFDLVGLTVALLVIGGWAALRPSQQWWPACCVGAAAVWVGGAALVWPRQAASPGIVGGVLAIIAGGVVLGRAASGIRASHSGAPQQLTPPGAAITAPTQP